MTQIIQKERVEYVVLPRVVWEKRVPQSAPVLRALREAISRVWKGQGAVEEIRAQRQKS